MVGFLSSISIGYSCVRASEAVGDLLKMSKKFKNDHGKDFVLPPTIGARSKGIQWLLPWKFLTWIFGASWILLSVYKLSSMG